MKVAGALNKIGRDLARVNFQSNGLPLVTRRPIDRDQLTIFLSALIPERVKVIHQEIDLLERPTGRYFYQEPDVDPPQAGDKSPDDGVPEAKSDEGQDLRPRRRVRKLRRRGDQESS